MDVNEYDVGFIEWIVNTGDDRLYAEGNIVSRYYGDNKTEVIFDGSEWLVDSLDSKYKAPEAEKLILPEVSELSKTDIIAISIISLLVAVTISGTIIIIKNRRIKT